VIPFGTTEEEFLEFYRTQRERVRRTLRGITNSSAVAEELTQEAFLKAWRNLPFFQRKSSLKTWVFQVAINVGRDWLRSHPKGASVLEERAEESKTSPETRAIQEALVDLEEETRTLLVLFYYEGLTLQELAKVLGVPLGTVKSRLHTAKGQLRSLLEKKGFDV
jgi:RNA polymerase sigma-70 factor (ECF subfamily)